MLDKSGLGNVQIVATDGGWDIAKDMLTDAALSKAIDYIG